MHKINQQRLIPLLLALLFSGSATASGFQLFETSVSGLGNAYAGSAAVAENATTLFFNPAGMTQLQDHEISIGATYVKANFEFSNNASATDAFSNSGNGGNAGKAAIIPNAYMSWALNKEWYVGLGISAPFGLMTEYSAPWIGGAQSLKFEIKTLNINPSVAWRANEFVALGLGLNWQQMQAEYVKMAGTIATLTTSPITIPPLNTSTAVLNADDAAWGWNAGALFTLSPNTKVGLSYRSSIKHKLQGSVTTSGPFASFNAANTGSAGAEMTLPDTFFLSLSQALNDRVELLADISRTGWSSIEKVDIVRTDLTTGNPIQTINTNFRDTWRVAIGGNYKLSDAIKLRAGLAYDQTPVKGADTRLVSLPDNDRTWLSLGVQWKPSKTSALDIGGAYLFVKDAPVNNNQNTALPAQNNTVNGTYKDSAFLFGAQFSVAF